MNIAAYCRVSTGKNEQLDSLENQKEFFTKYAENNGHKLVSLYADEGISGTSLKKREQFKRLMLDAEEGLFETVVVKDISRFARNTVDFLSSIRRLKALGINTLFLTANMESLGESEFILTVFSALAQEESVNLSKRIKFGKKINAEKGRVPRIIFGYDRVDNFNLKINQEEAEVVREIFNLYLKKGIGCSLIADELNGRGVRTKQSCLWNPTGVRRILNNSLYCGEFINRKYEIKDCLEGKQLRLPSEENIHHQRPEWAIISRKDFEQAQILLNERKAQYKATSALLGRQSNKHLFSSLIRCEQCGRAFCRKKYRYSNTRYYWKCQTNDKLGKESCCNNITITEKELLEIISNYIQSRITDKESFISKALFEANTYLNVKRSTLKPDVEKETVKLKIKADKYREMFASELISLSDLKEKLKAVEKEIKSLENIPKTSNERKKANREAVEAFLALENVNIGDLRKIIKTVKVNDKGEIKVHIRSFI